MSDGEYSGKVYVRKNEKRRENDSFQLMFSIQILIFRVISMDIQKWRELLGTNIDANQLERENKISDSVRLDRFHGVS